MKKILFLSITLLLSLNVFAQEQGEMSADEKAWMEYMQPGEPHEMMAKAAGTWKVETKMWMDPAGDPEINEGTAVNEMILGGRYLKQSMTSTAMGMPMEGIGIDAYDNAKQKYISIWLDNFGTGIAYAEGEWDDEIGGIVYWGTMTDPVSGGDSDYKIVITHQDDNHMRMDMYMVMDEEDVKNMEMNYTRVK